MPNDKHLSRTFFQVLCRINHKSYKKEGKIRLNVSIHAKRINISKTFNTSQESDSQATFLKGQIKSIVFPLSFYNSKVKTWLEIK